MDYDYVIWFDADVMVMNHDIDIFSYVDQQSNLTISEDINYKRIRDLNKRVNTGVMIWEGKNGFSRNMLDRIYNGDNFYTNNPFEFFHEQSSIIENIEQEEGFEKNVTVCPKLGNYWFSNSKSLKLQDIFLDCDTPHSNAIRIFNTSEKRKVFLECLRRDLFFEKGDFLVHFAGVPNEERQELFELFSHHVLWH